MELTNTYLPQHLIDLVIEQFGDENYFKERAEDVANHGAAGGFNGFTYYSDTVPFGEKIRVHVKPILQDISEELGENGIISMMSKWQCLDGFSEDEIADGWACNEDESAHTAVMNAISWFALEEVARAYVANMEE